MTVPYSPPVRLAVPFLKVWCETDRECLVGAAVSLADDLPGPARRAASDPEPPNFPTRQAYGALAARPENIFHTPWCGLP